MSKKKNNLVLIIVLVILVIVVGVNELLKSSRGERTFRKDIVEMEASEITKLTIYPKNAGNKTVDIFQQDSVWQLKVDDKLFAADQELISGIVDELAAMVPERLVANNKDLWKNYDITDSLGVKLTVYGSKKNKTDLTLGRFSYDEATRKPSTYVRIGKEKEVYAVDGYMGMTFNREINSLRDKALYRGNQNDIKEISFQYPSDSAYSVIKQDNQWAINGVPVDSARMAGYLTNVSFVVGSEFRDDFIPAATDGNPLKVVLSGPDMKTVEISAFRDAKGIVLNSSTNEKTYFSGETGDQFKKIFQPRNYFFPVRDKE